jgi:hypothetical protein
MCMLVRMTVYMYISQLKYLDFQTEHNVEKHPCI